MNTEYTESRHTKLILSSEDNKKITQERKQITKERVIKSGGGGGTGGHGGDGLEEGSDIYGKGPSTKYD